MSGREFIALGTGSQVPTRERNHNAYMLRWDGESVLFDPGEGAQRQLTLANIAASSIHHICITHFHGDHCLGLPGILQRLSVDRCDHPVHLYYPESGQIYVDRLKGAAIYQSSLDLQLHPVCNSGNAAVELFDSGAWTLKSLPLEHSVPTIGYRFEENSGLRFLREKLELLGVGGPMVGELRRAGAVLAGGRMVRLEDVTSVRPGCVLAFIMDTRFCAGALALAENADLAVIEATYTTEQQDLADMYLHSSATDAARTAKLAAARKLALTHFSQRYIDTERHLKEAGGIFPNVIALHDLDRIDIPRSASHDSPISKQDHQPETI